MSMRGNRRHRKGATDAPRIEWSNNVAVVKDESLKIRELVLWMIQYAIEHPRAQLVMVEFNSLTIIVHRNSNYQHILRDYYRAFVDNSRPKVVGPFPEPTENIEQLREYSDEVLSRASIWNILRPPPRN